MGGIVYCLEDDDHIKSYSMFIKKVDIFFKEHAKEYDAVHLHSAIFSYPILFSAKKYGIKTRIVHTHSSSLGNTKLHSLRNRITLLPMRKWANHFWACSEEAAVVWYKSIGIKKYDVINNGFLVEKYYRNLEIRAQYRNMLGINDEAIVIGHISNMSPIKNIPFLMEVAKKIIDKGYNVKIVLIGKNELPSDVRECINIYKLNDYILNMGIREDIYNCIQAFDVCFMPSLSEGYGMVPIEVQLAKVPVIISNKFPGIISSLPLSFETEFNSDKWLMTFESIMKNMESIQKDKYDMHVYEIFDIKKIVETIIYKYKLYLDE